LPPLWFSTFDVPKRDWRIGTQEKNAKSDVPEGIGFWTIKAALLVNAAFCLSGSLESFMGSLPFEK
jgi:hypothetical protein